jgi:hypothetical protein
VTFFTIVCRSAHCWQPEAECPIDQWPSMLKGWLNLNTEGELQSWTRRHGQWCLVGVIAATRRSASRLSCAHLTFRRGSGVRVRGHSLDLLTPSAGLSAEDVVTPLPVRVAMSNSCRMNVTRLSKNLPGGGDRNSTPASSPTWTKPRSCSATTVINQMNARSPSRYNSSPALTFAHQHGSDSAG